MLVISPGNDDGFGLHGVKPGNGARGAGADGVVDIGDPVQYPHDLQPVLHPGKRPGHPGADLVGDHALHRGKRGQIVQHVVFPGKLDLRRGKNFPAFPCLYAAERAVSEHGTVLHVLPV